MQGRKVLYKVVAYITREKDGLRQLLVFKHRDYPDAGVQVPAGTIEDGESVEAALVREIEEKSGLTGLELIRKVGTFYYTHPDTGNLHVRNVFLLKAPADTPDAWEWIETSSGEVLESEGYVFQFYWVALDGEITLAGGQRDYLEGALGEGR